MAKTTIGMGEAAKLANVSKSTLTRAVKAGRLSAERDDTGSYRIEISELERVYPMKAHQGAAPATTHHASPSDTGRDAVFEAEIEGLKAQLALMRDALDDAKEQRDGWQRQAEAAQRLLPDLSTAPRRRWFGFGR